MSTHILLFALAVAVAAEVSHHCIHGHPDIQAEAQRALETTVPQRYAEGRVGTLAASGRSPLRIVVFYDNLDDPSKYCTAVGDVRPSYRSTGQTETCTADDILTDAKRSFLREDLVPSAVQRLSEVFNVTRVVGPLQVGSATVCGTDIIISASAVSPGVSDADFVLYVSAGPLGASGQSTLAFAAPCASDSSTPIPRPIVGRANFNPRFLTRDTVEPSATNTLARDTALHEICHALGFTSSFFSSLTSTGMIRSKTVTWFNGPVVTAACQAYFNCSAQSPCAEIEDEGPAGSRGTHWDKRMTFAELMVASGGAYLSVFTLGMFEDMGMYSPDYSRAQSMVAGRGVGCPFLREKCNVPASNPFDEWCFVADQVGCTPDRRSIGPCAIAISSTPWPPEFRYFANPYEGAVQVFTDGCPYRIPFSERRCSFSAPTTNLADLLDAGFYYGAGGRCIVVDGVRRVVSQIVASVVNSVGGSTGAGNYRCLRVRCPYGGERVEIQVDTVWSACPLDGTASTIPAPSGFVGTITCPAAPQICTDDITVGSNRRETLPDGSAILPFNTGFNYFTITLEFNGTQWTSVVGTRSQVNPIENAVRIDLGRLLRVGSASLDVRQIVPSASGVVMQVGLINDGTNALSLDVITTALQPYYLRSTAFPTLNTVYSRYAAAAYVALSRVSSLGSASLCPGLTDSTCVLVVSLSVGISVALILLIVVYCVCVRSPFSPANPPMPSRQLYRPK